VLLFLVLLQAAGYRWRSLFLAALFFLAHRNRRALPMTPRRPSTMPLG
jgi:hypothetical protein